MDMDTDTDIDIAGRNFEASKGKTRQWLARFASTRPVIIVPVFNAYEDTLECLESLLNNTAANIPILLIDDASPDARLYEYFEPLAFKDRLAYLRNRVNSGFVGSVNLGFELAARHDVIVINSDVVVPPGWLERLQAAAYSGSTVATATPLTNHGSIISVPYRNQPSGELALNLTLAETDARIREASLNLYPIIPAAVGHCIYFKRAALDLIGGFDLSFAPGYGEEVDFSQRAVMVGLSNVLADDLFVYHKGSRSFNNVETRQQLRDEHAAIIQQRYPWYLAWVGEAMSLPDSPLALALENACRAILGYNIGLDATCLDGKTNGTQVLTLELTRALVEQKAAQNRLTLIVRDDIPAASLAGLEKLVDEVITVSELKKRPQSAFDLIHRPFQIYSLEDLELLQQAAARFIVTHLDSLAYATPGYAPNADWWAKLRHFTRLTFAAGDGIIFISRAAQAETTQQGLTLPEERACLTYVGVNHQLHRVPAKPPGKSSQLLEQPFILMLGTNYQHKNRPFALRLFAGLIQDYAWPGKLVFAGGDKPDGGSSLEESREFEQYPALEGHVINLGAIDEGEKQWLLEKAALLLYPSTVEGFGMVPFEAAAAGTPALTARLSSPGEVLGENIIYLESFEPAEAAHTVWQLLTQPELALRQTENIQAQARAFTWEKVAEVTWEFYRQILRKAPRLPNATTRQLSQLSGLEQEYRKLQGWSEELNRQLITSEKNRLLSRLKRLRRA